VNTKEVIVKNKIFVSMPSWRDPFVYETIKSAYEQAYNKDRLVFGVLFQGYPEDDWMIDEVQSKLPDANINIKKVHGDDAPDYLCDIKQIIIDEFMTDEAYYMQVDCHTKFRKNWDIMLEAELLIANIVFGKSIINSQTIYFDSWKDELIADPLTSYPDLGEWEVIGNTLDFPEPIALNGLVIQKPNNLMIKENFYNGNMVFAYSDYVREVPFAKNMAQCFEQQLSMLRAWTAGYEVVSPIHLYTNNFNYWNPSERSDSYVRHIRWDRPEQQARIRAANLESYEKFKKIFTDPETRYNPDFGAFRERTVEDFIEFIGYNPFTLEITRDPQIDMDNAIIITDEIFSKTITQLTGIQDTDSIINDPHTRRESRV
jgi:hypothetical protein